VTLRGTAAIIGIGESEIGRVPERDGVGLTVDAARRAIDDAGVATSDVDGVITTPVFVKPYPRQANVVAEQLGIRPRFQVTWQNSGASGCSMIGGAAAAIRAGLASTVLVASGDNELSGLGSDGTIAELARQRDPDLEAPHGLTVPALFAMVIRAYMHRYGVSPEQAAAVAVTMREHAGYTDKAQMSEPITVDDVLASPMVASPLRRLDCSLISDGAAAAVVTSAARVDDRPAAFVLGFGEGYSHELIIHSPSLTTFAAVESGRRAYEMARIGPPEIDVAGIYDCFSGVVLIELEDLGLCPTGEAGAFVTDGGIRIGGTIPVNTNGGLLSYCHPGYPGGLFHVVEVARQLMRKADRRQIDAEVGLVHNMGGTFSTNSTLILGTGSTR